MKGSNPVWRVRSPLHEISITSHEHARKQHASGAGEDTAGSNEGGCVCVCMGDGSVFCSYMPIHTPIPIQKYREILLDIKKFFLNAYI